MPSMARPITGLPPPGAVRETEAHTVVSVGPYALNMARPGAHRSTSCWGRASPAHTIVSRCGSSRSGTMASTLGGRVMWVIRVSARKSPRPGPYRTSRRGGRTRVAPEHSAMASSKTDASKLGEANCSTRWPGLTVNVERWASARLASPRWVSVTPLGRPVEPEV